jgi:hypothetical protein
MRCRGAWRSRSKALQRRQLRGHVTEHGWSLDSRLGASGSSNGTTFIAGLWSARSDAGARLSLSWQHRQRPWRRAARCQKRTHFFAPPAPSPCSEAPRHACPQRGRRAGHRHVACATGHCHARPSGGSCSASPWRLHGISPRQCCPVASHCGAHFLLWHGGALLRLLGRQRHCHLQPVRPRAGRLSVPPLLHLVGGSRSRQRQASRRSSAAGCPLRCLR